VWLVQQRGPSPHDFAFAENRHRHRPLARAHADRALEHHLAFGDDEDLLADAALPLDGFTGLEAAGPADGGDAGELAAINAFKELARLQDVSHLVRLHGSASSTGWMTAIDVFYDAGRLNVNSDFFC